MRMKCWVEEIESIIIISLDHMPGRDMPRLDEPINPARSVLSHQLRLAASLRISQHAIMVFHFTFHQQGTWCLSCGSFLYPAFVRGCSFFHTLGITHSLACNTTNSLFSFSPKVPLSVVMATFRG